MVFDFEVNALFVEVMPRSIIVHAPPADWARNSPSPVLWNGAFT